MNGDDGENCGSFEIDYDRFELMMMMMMVSLFLLRSR
jgi:hypothetical protein